MNMMFRFNSKKLVWIGFVAGCIAVVLAVEFGVDATVEAPDTAVVMVDAKSRAYFAPPCLPNPGGEGFTTLENARKLGLARNKQCEEAGGFVQKGRSPIGALLEQARLIAPLRSRWNKDGSWNW